jgi:hypothetical protein
MIISVISSPVRCAIIALSYFPTDLAGAIQTVPRRSYGSLSGLWLTL